MMACLLFSNENKPPIAPMKLRNIIWSEKKIVKYHKLYDSIVL